MINHFNKQHISLLINAFNKDPMFVKLFKGPKKHRQMDAFFKFIYKRNQLMNGIYLTDSSNTPSYVAFIEPPRDKHRYPLKNKFYLLLRMLILIFYIPIKSLNFLSLYDATTMKQRPAQKHYYLTMIGVSPNKQGQGIGKKIINNIHDIVINDPETSSIYLDTENSINVSFYNHLGYELIHKTKLSSITIYCMENILKKK